MDQLVVVVTGSREWVWDSVIWDDLKALPDNTLLGVGDCPTGADAIATTAWRALGHEPRIFRADWDRYKHAAGPIRNGVMLRTLRPTILLAYLMPNSRGTRDCVAQARANLGSAVEIRERHLKPKSPRHPNSEVLVRKNRIGL